ncbi:unnamed protein product [Polarella glacialis]|uniref:Uncharacterized protein n=1 Tax=Polarella glacialis TaxID=89957 RepID=A0A813IYY3_POLGL|nr:unnamed protein product [Polarella glacialis]
MPALMSKMRGAPENLSKHRSSENRPGKRAFPASLPVASLAAGACLLGSMPSFLQPSQAPAGQSAARDQMLRGGQRQNVHGAVEQQSVSSHYSSANAGLLGAAGGALCLLGHASNSRALRVPAVVLMASAGAEAPKAAFQPAKQMGATAPLGFFDPVGFSKEGDESGFRNLRAAEIKHGRVAMMAAVGAVAQHYIQFPGFEGVPADLAAVTSAPGSYGFAALFILSGVAELAIWKQDDKKEPGNFGDPLGLGQYNEDMRSKELNNGRMAMIAALGIVAADIFTGKDGMQQLGLGAIRERTSRVALRATAAKGDVFQPAKQMGATAPLGFFDPVGFSKEGDESGFRNLRAAEIKHGRVAMMAAVGAVAQHYIQFPGFAGVPADLAAVTTAPGSYGFAALFILSGVAELAIWKQDDKKEPGNFGDPLGLGQYNEDMRGKELNNGRMAMIAALGIVAADIFTGKDGMQQLGLGAIRERTSRVALSATAAQGDVFQPAKQMGATAPLGFFDPIGFTKEGDESGFRNLRAAEIKHGRVAMMAAVGAVAQHDIQFPGFEGVPADLAAVTTAPGSYGFAALFILSGVAELAIWKQDDKKESGNFGDPLGLGQYNEDMRGKELNNGRVAMVAALGIVAADIFTGKDGMQQLGLGAIRERTSRVALRATAAKGDVFQPAKQMGATAPLGFFDPVGFAKEGDESGFRNLRAAEIKHGRVAMMAAVGAVAQHYIQFPGFEGVPADLAAVTTAPGSYGFAALFILSGVAELAIWKQDDKKEPGNFGDPLGLGQYNEDMRGKELNNGRMAMIAALGIVAADIFTGKDGMQQLGLGAIRERTSRVALRATAAQGDVFQPAKQMGATAPLGFFDPVGFAKEGDESGFRNLRVAEIKHGRVAMMAAVGAVAQHYIQFPGFEGVPADLAAVTSAPGSYGFAALFILSGVAELAIWKQDDKKEPGNFGDPLRTGTELNNGRMAMIAALGIVAADIFTGKDGMQQLGLGAIRERTSRVALRATAEKGEVFQPAKQMGATAPLGFFDPVGFSKEGDESGFRNLRAAEIKHGRVAMMAAVGAVAQHYIQFPGFEGVPADLAAVTTAPGSYGFAALFILSGVAELAIWKQDDKKEPGNFGDPLGLGQYNEDMRGKELNNGRMAMIAALGIVAADIFTGKDGMQQLGLGAMRERTSRVALRATAAQGDAFQPAKQMGATAPLGFFDPVGFAKEGDESGFRNLRAAEIKHGRVAMMAAVGAVAQHYIQFPGFEGVPADLAAVTTAPGSYGFAALFILSGVAELAIWKQDDKKEPGNFGDPLGLGQYNEDMRGKELNNGRMAMIAALGIVAADIFTGKDGMQQLGLGAIRERTSRVALREGDESGFRNLRAAEIKHGRVAMMAAVGAVAQHYIQFPGFEGVPADLAAVTTAPGSYGFAALFILSGVAELAIWKQDDKKEPGNFGDPLGLGQYNEDMRGKELNNGRMAMIAALGIVAADIFTGKDGMQQLGF